MAMRHSVLTETTVRYPAANWHKASWPNRTGIILPMLASPPH